MATYTSGYTLKSLKDITKNDIIILCNLLNNNENYIDICTFEPEPITEDGIIYKFINNNTWYKTVRFNLYVKWDWIDENVMTMWNKNKDILLRDKQKMNLFLKSFHGAPVFTLDELQIWESCFNEIGLKKVGKYPSKKSLITEDKFG